MGSTQPSFLRAIACAVTVVIAASTLPVATAASASADPAVPAPVSSSALPTAQVNGVVWAQVVANGIDYVAGSFNQSQPAGAAPGVATASRANLFAFDVSTGAAVAFTARANAQVRGITASPDGSRIYIVGDFTSVNGTPRNHLAALTPSGALVKEFAPDVNGTASSVVARGNTVYLGGRFTAVNGRTRAKAAAVDSAGALLPFAPSVAGGDVRAVSLSPNSKRVLIGGSFTATNGVSTRGLAALDASSGATQPWTANRIIYNSGVNSAIYSLSTRGTVVYATGYVTKGVDQGNLEGTVAMNWSDGSVAWIEDCHGDSYSSYPFNGAVYVASHAHDCSNVVGGWSSPGTPTQWRRAQAFSQSAVGTLRHNTQSSYYDFGGIPSPKLVDRWSPSINTGSYTGMNQGAWSVTGGGSVVVFGGEFTAVNGLRQTGLVRFQGQPEPADPSLATPTPTPTPTSGEPSPPQSGKPGTAPPARVSAPHAITLGPSKVAVKWSAPARGVTGYRIYVYKRSVLVKTVNVGSAARVAVVGKLARATAYRIGVAAKNAHGVGKRSVLDAVRTKSKGRNVSATKRPSKVGTVTYSTGAGKLRVRWPAATATGALPVTKYEVRVSLKGAAPRTYVVDDELRAKLVTKLKRHTRYTISVRAGNWAGWGARSAARAARTS